MSAKAQRLTKRQQRLSEKGLMKFPTIQQLHFDLKQIQPITDNQVRTFNAYNEGENLFLHGCAGTGKTFISIYLALKEIENGRSRRRKLVIIRTAQSSKDIGFLPGSEKQKLEVYEAPYKAICAELYHRDDAYDILKQKGIIEFHSTSFLRGTTIDDSIILIDECQNQRYVELRTVLTRTGDRSRVILCGDTKQDDLTSDRYKETSGLADMMKVFNRMGDMTTVEFEIDDIVRSGFVRDFIIAENQLGLY
ncbi:PhoH Phosphate starvation-inducible protein PhoH, predicted ATPase [uncultured Caudovirales phage]|uniref:PhoH Phosphate starvation-inducible protein PhoH, predicted ATPase n=1 Tax=uncultured Caudovirales phage TaxID=2100421 RepID=A0A6J5MEG6_9CAUD|nr:PhoH Phosphate starvation-inducible protein PhoH, predicted ATPase [uncultured Caudovirales phage]